MIKQVIDLKDGKKGQLFYMRNIIDFKDSRISEEWFSNKLNPRLTNYILMIALYTWTEYNKRITLTSIYRTKEEEKVIGGSGIHTCWRGVDIRTSNFTEIEINKIVEWTNTFLHYDSANICFVSVYGDTKHRDHIHCQVGWRK